MSGEEDPSSHVRIHPRCGACGFPFTAGDRIINRSCDSTFNAAYDAFTFPDSAYCTQSHSYPVLFCRFPECRRCATAAESATVHEDCLLLFLRISEAEDKLEQLWTVATWRNPWLAAPQLDLVPGVDILRGMGFAAKACGLLKMARLPIELTRMIYERSRQSSVWRYTSVLDLALSLSRPQLVEPRTVPIDKVHAWRRGNPPRVEDSANEPSHCIIRLTMDSQGLQGIERLGTGSLGSSISRPDSTAYVVEPAEYFSGVLVEFKLGRARLRVPSGSKGFHIWDTACPPPLQQCPVDLAYKLPPSRLTTIQTRTCTGITFFILCSTGSLLAIHAHTDSRPSALDTFESLPRRQQNAVMWLYVPIRDEIVAFGISQPRSKATRSYIRQTRVLIRLRLGGDVFVGPYYSEQPQRFLLTAQPLTLVYERPEFIPVSFIGIYSACHKAEEISLAPPFHGSPPFESAYFSLARLEDVAIIRIFNDGKTQACRGIIIQYGNGSQRALGQCRVGIDRDQIVTGPRRLCLASVVSGRSYTGSSFAKSRWKVVPLYVISTK